MLSLAQERSKCQIYVSCAPVLPHPSRGDCVQSVNSWLLVDSRPLLLLLRRVPWQHDVTRW